MNILRQVQRTVNELLGTKVPTDQVWHLTLRNCRLKYACLSCQTLR